MIRPRLGDLSAIKLTLMAREARDQAQPLLRADPIAIVGIGCRVPCGDSPEHFWKLLCGGVDAIREVPADRWDGAGWFDPDPSASGKAMTRSGGFLDAIDGFDASYFDILPREAARMDPQQRLLLEVAIEALDDAGQSRERLGGARAGVFIASYHSDYAHLQYGDLEEVDARTLTGTLHSVLANRLSYLLDLRGPSVSIDTACSSSLVATHLACQSLRSGESDLAVAGGVSLMITPELMVSLSKVGFMAPDGRCKTFDARADGFGRGEGCGVVVLKRLADAIAERDRVLAVIRGSAVNQDGHSTVLAAPNGLAQQAMIVEALASAELDAARIGFVETHGTGTALGDPIEVEALAATVGRPAPGAGACLLGAAKANLGHLEAAAGVIGLIKAVLVLQNGAVPPQVHFTRLNPHISLEHTRLAIPTALVPWPAGPTPRCASVSSFGVGGTNAHVILEEAPRLPAGGRAAPDVSRVLPLSAQSPEALRALVADWIRFLPETTSSVADLCFTASERRTHYRHRRAVVGRTKEDLRARLCQPPAPAPVPPPLAARIAFVFSGQGPQWHAMGRELLASEPVFRDVLSDCDRLLRPLAGWSLTGELAADASASRLDQTAVAQPALFALQVGLAALWKSWGITPDAVVGHSVGEVAALHVAGVLSLPEAMRIVWHRGRIMQEATGLGRMASVGLTPDQASELVAPLGDRLGIGAINGPRSVVLSGDTAALEVALATLTERGVAHRMLPVHHAFHSAQMAPFQRRLAAALGTITRTAPTLAFYSTVTGALATGDSFDPSYFARNIREPVRFASAVAALARDGHDVFLEIGPHPVLAVVLSECLEASAHAARVLSSLRRDRPERESLLAACAGLYEAGGAPSWSALQQAPGEVVTLPAYPWQRKRHWIRARPAAAGERAGTGTGHPLLGRRVPAAGIGAQIFEGGPEAESAWLADHRILGRLLLPAAAVMELFHAAVAAALGGEQTDLTGFAMHRPLLLPEATDSRRACWQTVVTTRAPGGAELRLYEESAGGWRRVASASVGPRSAVAAIPEVGAGGPLAADDVYTRFAQLGVAFGPRFRNLDHIRLGDGIAEAWVDLPPGLEAPRTLHPVVLDAGLQLCTIAARREEVLLPLGADRLQFLQPAPTRVRVRARVRHDGPETSLTADLSFESPDGLPVAVIEGMRFAPARSSAFAVPDRIDEALYEVVWRRARPLPTARRADGDWLIFADRGGIGEALTREIAAAGGRTHQVLAGTSYARTDGGSFRVDPASPDHFRRLFADRGWAELCGAVHLWSLDEDGGDPGLLAVGSMLHLVQTLDPAGPVSVVTRGAQVVSGEETPGSLCPRAAGAWGLASVVAAERPELQVRRIDLDPRAPGSAGLLAELVAAGEASVALRGGERWVPGLERRRAGATADAGPLALALVRPGTTDGVELRPAARAALRPGQVRLRVLASGINFRDVLLTLGMYPGAAPLGVECCGVVTELGEAVGDLRLGDRVFGFAPGSLATEVTVPAAFLAPAPPGLSDEQAAATPVAFLTALYGLDRIAGLRAGQRVLVHAAAGGVGMAAVQLARRRGAQVFATAGSEEKRALLRSLGVCHVMDSRSLAFAGEIRAATAGAGVDVVLNSLAGAFIPASLECLGRDGWFLELGKRDILTPEAAARLRPDVRYRAYDLGAEAEADHGLLRPMLDELLAALADGSLCPLPVTVYPLDRVRDAFRFMAQARHVGKIVARPAGAAPLVSAASTYWITGGLGALGLETARWLARAGATHLVLSGRRPPGPAATETLGELERLGVQVHVFQADAADRAGMQAILDAIHASHPPLRGVIHAAGVLDDGVLASQTWERCRAVLSGKADGAFVLDELTRDLPLDFFVLYSAAGLLLGAPGQGAYPAANAQLDVLAHARRRQGLPALSIAWGLWEDTGMAAHGGAVWAARGLEAITPATGFASLERLLRDDAVSAAVLLVDWPRFLGQLAPGVDCGFFAALGGASAPPGAMPPVSLAASLAALPDAQRRAALRAHLVEHALQVIGLSATTPVDPQSPLKELGLDSLMAVELRNALARSTGQPLPATLLFDYPTIEALAAHLARLLGLAGAASPETGPTRSTEVSEIAALSDDEAEARLVAELKERSTPRSHGPATHRR